MIRNYWGTRGKIVTLWTFGCHGSRSSPSIFNSFADLICWIIQNPGGFANVVHYSDDFLELEFRTTPLTGQYFGRDVDFLRAHQVGYLPGYRNLLDRSYDGHSERQIHGTDDGTPVMRQHIIAKNRKCTKLSFVSKIARDDIRWWIDLTPSSRCLYSDATFVGCGGLCKQSWFQHAWVSLESCMSIDSYELFAIYAAVITCGSRVFESTGTTASRTNLILFVSDIATTSPYNNVKLHLAEIKSYATANGYRIEQFRRLYLTVRVIKKSQGARFHKPKRLPITFKSAADD